jgi:hypothetical protein
VFKWLLIGLCLMAGMAAAKPGTPGPSYFSGVYERIGRSSTDALQNDQISIAPLGQLLTLTPCQGDQIIMAFGPAFEINNLMTGAQSGLRVECLFHNNGYNRPILTCRMEDNTAFTLWPTKDKTMVCPP